MVLCERQDCRTCSHTRLSNKVKWLTFFQARGETILLRSLRIPLKSNVMIKKWSFLELWTRECLTCCRFRQGYDRFCFHAQSATCTGLEWNADTLPGEGRSILLVAPHNNKNKKDSESRFGIRVSSKRPRLRRPLRKTAEKTATPTLPGRQRASAPRCWVAVRSTQITLIESGIRKMCNIVCKL